MFRWGSKSIQIRPFSILACEWREAFAKFLWLWWHLFRNHVPSRGGGHVCWYISQNICFNSMRLISGEQRSWVDNGKYIIAIFYGALKAREDGLTACTCVCKYICTYVICTHTESGAYKCREGNQASCFFQYSSAVCLFWLIYKQRWSYVSWMLAVSSLHHSWMKRMGVLFREESLVQTKRW